MESSRPRQRRVSHPQHARWHPCRRWLPHRARLSHRTLRSRSSSRRLQHREFKQHNAIPFAGFVSDPCDGRTQGTSGMMDSLAYRNDAATVLRKLIRSLPTRKGVLGHRHLRQRSARDDDRTRRTKILAVRHRPWRCDVASRTRRRCREDPITRRTFCAWIDHSRRSIRLGMPCLCIAWGRLSIPRNGGNQSGCGRGAGTSGDTFGVGAIGSGDLAGHGKTIRTCVDRDVSAKHHHRATSSQKTRSTTRW